MVKNKSKHEFRLIEVEKGVYTLPYSGKHPVVEIKNRCIRKGKMTCPFCTDRVHTEFTLWRKGPIIEVICIHCGKLAYRIGIKAIVVVD